MSTRNIFKKNDELENLNSFNEKVVPSTLCNVPLPLPAKQPQSMMLTTTMLDSCYGVCNISLVIVAQIA